MKRLVGDRNLLDIILMSKTMKYDEKLIFLSISVKSYWNLCLSICKITNNNIFNNNIMKINIFSKEPLAWIIL